MSNQDNSSDSENTAGAIPALRSQVRALESEVGLLRRKLVDTPKRVSTLEERLLETKTQLAQAVSQNEKLTFTLRLLRCCCLALFLLCVYFAFATSLLCFGFIALLLP